MVNKEVWEEEFESKNALAKELEDYYSSKTKELGLKDFKRILKFFPNVGENVKKGIIFAHYDFEKILEAIAEKKPWAVVSGLNPSGPLHFGHKAIFDELLWMQKNGAEIYIPVTNDESYVVGKTKSIAESRKIAYEEVIPSIIAFGFNPEKTHIYVDSDYPDIYNVAMDISTKLTLNKAFGVFGFDKTEKGENPGTMFYRSAVQLAQILLPQYPEFGGPKPTLIPVGIDQHPYILLARDVAGKKGFIPPSEIVTKFLPSLKGPGKKMSAHLEDSCIYLTDSPEQAEKKIKKAYTGGLSSAKYQQEVGGIPEICPIFQLLHYHFLNEIESKELYLKYKEGKILNKELKEITITKVKNYLEEHKKKREEAKKIISKFILNKKINSILS